MEMQQFRIKCRLLSISIAGLAITSNDDLASIAAEKRLLNRLVISGNAALQLEALDIEPDRISQTVSQSANASISTTYF